MRDLFERFQLLQATVRELSHIVHETPDAPKKPTIEELTVFAAHMDDCLFELSSLKSDVIEHFIA